MSSSNESNITLRKGNILGAKSHALINTVNCVGIMGKGIALAFKRKYPAMFTEYVKLCDKGLVKLGEPYPYFTDDHVVINFPTKQHWRSVSRLEDIEAGLVHLRSKVKEWGIHSIAVPPLGCGNGQLDWSVVRPTLVRHLREFDIPVELFVPHDVEIEDTQLSLLDDPSGSKTVQQPKVEPAVVALVEILNLLEHHVYHWPVGRIFFQKIAYFATVAGIPTGLEFTASNFGPFSPEVKRVITRLQNNGVVREEKRGRMFEVKVGTTFGDARELLADELTRQWRDEIRRVAELMGRFTTTQAEIAATVHYATQALASANSRTPTSAEVMDAVAKWKVRRDPPILPDDVGRSIVSLATQGWISVEADDSITPYLDELVPF